MNNLQSLSIVTAFPISVVIVMIAVSFIKDARKYMKELEGQGSAEDFGGGAT
jgi:BCCT family betaine/carnitine transporter